jgi:hypothetical protein
MKYRLVVLVILALVLTSSSNGVKALSGFSCPHIVQGPPCQEYWRADAVFIGLVTEIGALPWPESNPAHWQPYKRLTAHLSIEEAFRGVEGTEMTFVMDDCPYPFRQGERYLVYAHRGRDGKLYQRVGFSRTRPLSEAKEDLEYIRSVSQSSSGGRVFGSVTQHTHNIKEGRYDSEPMSGAKVLVQGVEHSYEALTDGAGKYEIVGVPAGDYRVSAIVPEHFGRNEYKIKVVERGCTPADVSVQPTGLISGRVVDANGQPLVNAGVSIVSAEGVSEEVLAGNRGILTYTDPQGNYSFDRLPAGRYVVIVNRRRSDLMSGSAVNEYPRTFHPGVTELLQAVIINLDEGQRRTSQDVRLLPR